MSETSTRMVHPERTSDSAQLETWLGRQAHGLWTRLPGWIGTTYPGVFAPEWLVLHLNRAGTVRDGQRLLEVKRKP